jgi:hypothetical protein
MRTSLCLLLFAVGALPLGVIDRDILLAPVNIETERPRT